jgi:hypothetical protein
MVASHRPESRPGKGTTQLEIHASVASLGPPASTRDFPVLVCPQTPFPTSRLPLIPRLSYSPDVRHAQHVEYGDTDMRKSAQNIFQPDESRVCSKFHNRLSRLSTKAHGGGEISTFDFASSTKQACVTPCYKGEFVLEIILSFLVALPSLLSQSIRYRPRGPRPPQHSRSCGGRLQRCQRRLGWMLIPGRHRWAIRWM